MAPTIGRVALDNGFHGSIPGDWVAPPPQNIQEKERKMQEAMLEIKKKFGKNAILKGMNLQEGATAKDRNQQIGGHKA